MYWWSLDQLKKHNNLHQHNKIYQHDRLPVDGQFRIRSLFYFRYDLLAGFNAQEGRLFLTLSLRAFPDVNITNGVSQEMAERILSNECSRAFTPNSPAMCQYFLDTLYRLKHSRSDRVRAIRLTDILGKISHSRLTNKGICCLRVSIMIQHIYLETDQLTSGCQ